MDDAPNKEQPELSQAVTRAMLGRCPSCGVGRLFRRYLNQVENCLHCNEKFGHIRADDAPAWLTILIVGHVLAILLLLVVPDSTWPDWLLIVLMLSLTLILSLVLLPRFKGLFIAITWRNMK